ncbi:MAG TPA: CapA family protein [Thermoanaerobaculia bacterium]|nr:CapA family protein [Thermoanaerobaculia bacterium]HQR67945.1 CapA family protein [Thermoanaerobaculia bacterium]
MRSVLLAAALAAAGAALAQAPGDPGWDDRVTRLLREEPGDVILTAVGDLIFNEKISDRPEPDRRNLLRILTEADIAYGNLEFSINEHPELQKPFYNFRVGREFAWEVAATGINLVSLANNHALDFGTVGLEDCMRALEQSGITFAGAGRTLAQAHAPARKKVQGQKTRLALLSYMRYWTDRYRCADPAGPCLATINPAVILVAKDGGKVEAVEGPIEDDVKAMEDDVVLARRHNDVVLVSLHVHDVSHSRAYGIQDATPKNDEITFRRAVDAGADLVLGSGPHVLRGIEIYKGKPIFYSLGDFIYQYRTPKRIPVDLVHQRDSEIERPPNVSVRDRRDSREVMESVLVRLTMNRETLRRIELIPVTIDDEGPLYGVPRLAGAKRGREILERLQRLSAPYGTRIVVRDWYGEVQLGP